MAGLQHFAAAQDLLRQVSSKLATFETDDSTIEELNLEGNKISEKGLDSVIPILKTAKDLKLLNLASNGITNRLIKNKLKTMLPSIEIQF